jgi:hypothetical protein
MYSEQGGGATPLSYFLTEVTKEKKTVQKNWKEEEGARPSSP